MGFPESTMSKALTDVFPDKVELLLRPWTEKLNIGSGSACDPLWTNVDRCYPIESQNTREGDGCVRDFGDIRRLLDLYHPGQFALGFSHHTLEHIPYKEVDATLAQWFDVIQPGGVLYVCLPDTQWCVAAVSGGKPWQDLRPYRRGTLKAGCVSWEEAHSFILSGTGHRSTWWEAVLVAKLGAAGFGPVRVWRKPNLKTRGGLMAHCEIAVLAVKPRSAETPRPTMSKPSCAVSNYGVGHNSVLQGHRAIRDSMYRAGLVAPDGDLIYYGPPKKRHGYDPVKLFKKFVEKHGPPEVLTAQACVALELFRYAAEHCPSTVRVLQRNSTHAAVHADLLNTEYERVGLKKRVNPRLIERECAEYDLAHRILVLSRWVQSTFETMGLGDRVRYFGPQCLDEERWKPLHRPPDGTDFRVMFAGAGTVRKGLHVLCKAWRRLKPKDGEELVISGHVVHKDEEGELLKRELAKTPRCRVLGWAEMGHMPIRYAMSDVYCLPSIEEGSSNTCIEALAMSRPQVITPNCGNDIAEDNPGECALVVTASDDEALADALQRYRTDKKLRGRHGARGPQLVSKATGFRPFGDRFVEAVRQIWREKQAGRIP